MINKFIIHKKHEHNGNIVYLCNWAVIARARKWSYRWRFVTCKNCLKQLPTRILIRKDSASILRRNKRGDKTQSQKERKR